MQGCGTKTPNAAAVAAATCGLLGVMHMAKGKIFTIGFISMIVAAGFFDVKTLFTGSTASALGATPKIQVS